MSLISLSGTKRLYSIAHMLMFGAGDSGVAEHSHRSTLAADIVNNMKADLADFLEIPSTHDILIMQGTSRSLHYWRTSGMYLQLLFN